jgi:D-alanyl-lipoteichoic acid acyltransferase DltB (MBOAT superfamily)
MVISKGAILAGVLAYIAVGFLSLRVGPLSAGSRIKVFSILNLLTTGTVLCLFFGYRQAALYALWVLICYVFTNFYEMRRTRLRYWLAVTFPLVSLAAAKQVPGELWLGFSFMCLRLSYVAFELQKSAVEKPSILGYFGYAFYPATIVIGPINPLAVYLRSFQKSMLGIREYNDNLTRILIGLIKLTFFAPLAGVHSLSSLNGAHHAIGLLEFSTVCVGSYLYLYLEFSGACDVIIGVSAIMGVEVIENFDRPLSAQNPMEFWKRFHVSLYRYIHDVIFMPLAIFFSRIIGAREGIALAIFLVLLLVGAWHGTTYNFLLLGLVHAICLTIHYYFARIMNCLPKRVQERWNSSIWIKRICIFATFSYVSLSMVFFFNSWDAIKFLIGHRLVWIL